MRKSILKIFLITVLLAITVLSFTSCALEDIVTPNDGVLTYQLSVDKDYYIVTGLYDVFDLNMAAEITIPAEFNGLPVKSILYLAFYDCTNLTTVVIPDGVTVIGNWAFKDCYNLTNIDIPDSVTWIGNQAFLGCDSLTSIVIPDSVTSVGEWAFANCENLTIYCEAAGKPDKWDSDWNSDELPVVWGYKDDTSGN